MYRLHIDGSVSTEYCVIVLRSGIAVTTFGRVDLDLIFIN
jgi:hypothetical protein